MKIKSALSLVLIASIASFSHAESDVAEGNLDRDLVGGSAIIAQEGLLAAIFLKSSFRKVQVPSPKIAQANAQIAQINAELANVQKKLAPTDSAELAETQKAIEYRRKEIALAETKLANQEGRIKIIEQQVTAEISFQDQTNPHLNQITFKDDPDGYRYTRARIQESHERLRIARLDQKGAQNLADNIRVEIAAHRFELQLQNDKFNALNQPRVLTAEDTVAKETLQAQEKDLLNRRKNLQDTIAEELRKPGVKKGARFSFLKFVGGVMLAVDVSDKACKLYVLEDDNFGYIPMETIYNDLLEYLAE